MALVFPPSLAVGALLVGPTVAGANPRVVTPAALACHGSLLGTPLNRPIVGIAATPDQGGYWLVASDGGVFTFGDAKFYGSTGNLILNKPIVGMASTRDGNGYWLVASDGGIFSYGDAQFYGSTGNITLNQPVVAMAATAGGNGYWLAAADGGIFSFGTTTFFGSGPQAAPGVTDFNSFAPTTNGGGYIMANASRGYLLNFGDARYGGIGFNPTDTSPLAGLTQPVATANFSYWDATQAGGVELNNPGPTAGAGSQTSC